MSESNFLVYGAWFGTGLLVLIVALFVIAEFFLRPACLDKYSFREKLMIALVPLEYGSSVIEYGDRKHLRNYRLVWQTILVLVIVRVIIGHMLGNPAA